MKNILLNFLKYVLGSKYNYYKFVFNKNLLKTKYKDDIMGYKDEEVLIISVDNPNGGISVGGKHIHIDLLQQGLKYNKISNFLITCNENNVYGHKIKDVARFYKTTKFKMKKYEDIYFSVLVYDWIKQLEKQLEKLLIKENCIKVINCHDIISTIAAKNVINSTGKKIPIVTTLHGYFSDENVDYGGLKFKGYFYEFFKDLEREAYLISDKIIAVDTRIKEYVLSEVPNKNSNDIHIIKNAINDIRFSPIENDERIELLSKYKLPENTLFVPRRLVPKNGVSFVVESIKKIVDDNYKDFKLVVAGDGIERKKIENYIKDNNIEKYVELLGDITHDKILEYYKISKVVIIPSIPSNNVEEATSLSALEGMAMGKVTIATSVGGLKELISNGYNGFLVKSKDTEELAKRIVESLNMKLDEYNEIAKNARETVIKNHGYISHSLEFYNVFKKAMR